MALALLPIGRGPDGAGAGSARRQGQRASRCARLLGVSTPRHWPGDPGLARRAREPTTRAARWRSRDPRRVLRREYMDGCCGQHDGVHQRQGRASHGRSNTALRWRRATHRGLAQRDGRRIGDCGCYARCVPSRLGPAHRLVFRPAGDGRGLRRATCRRGVSCRGSVGRCGVAGRGVAGRDVVQHRGIGFRSPDGRFTERWRAGRWVEGRRPARPAAGMAQSRAGRRGRQGCLGERYIVVPPGGAPITGYLDEDGRATLEGLVSGTCQLRFPDLDSEAWSVDS